MITEEELYKVAAKHPGLEAAFEKAISIIVEMGKAAARPGIMAKICAAQLSLEYSQALCQLLNDYSAKKGYRHPCQI